MAAHDENPWGGAGSNRMAPLAARQRLEMLGGFVGFFAAIALVNAVGLIIAGNPSVLASGVLVFFLVLGALVFRKWRKVDRMVKGYDPADGT